MMLTHNPTCLGERGRLYVSCMYLQPAFVIVHVQALYICKLRPLIKAMPRVEEEDPEATDNIPAKQFF